MKNTLLALMLVSSLFVISCGADATKPQDAYKIQKTEVSSGTKTTNVTVTGNTVDVSTFASAGEKVTEIIEVKDSSSQVVNPTAITKNSDGGIYQFTVTGTSVSSVTYKYTKTIIAPIITKALYASTGAGGSLTIDDADFNDKSKLFEKQILSITAYGNNVNYQFNPVNNNITLNGVASYTALIIKYQYMDINLISEKPTKEGAIEATSIITLTQNDAGKTYVCKDVTANTYYYGIVPATGKITSLGTQNNNYQLWLY